jgi:hypothetical protein
MQRIDIVTKPRSVGLLNAFAGLNELRQAVLFIKENLSRTNVEDLQGRVEVYTEKLRELKKIRIARNAEAGTNAVD